MRQTTSCGGWDARTRKNWSLQGYTLFFLFVLKIDCEYSLEQPRRCGSNEYMQSMF